jgi:aminomethyltransferase
MNGDVMNFIAINEEAASGSSLATRLAPAESQANIRYTALREGAALTDCSGFGTFRFTGGAALAAVNRLVLSDVARLPLRRIVNTFVLREDGTAVADAYVINDDNGYLLITEGGSPAELLALAKSGPAGAAVEDLSGQLALLSIDGPFSWELMKDLVGVGILGARYLDVVPGLKLGGVAATVYRAGKTGEFGYLVAVPAEGASAALDALLTAGMRYRLAVCTTADLDLCKLENRVVNPDMEGAAAANVLELNCRVMVSRAKGDYVGREAVEQARAAGAQSRLVGLLSEVEGQEAANLGFCAGAEVSYRGTKLGRIVNAAYSPKLQRWIGVALLQEAYAHVGLDYTVGAVPVRTVSAPFITNRSLSVRPQEDSFFQQR